MNCFHPCAKNGWKQFARADDLQLGHVCILSYNNSRTMLTVKVFDRTAEGSRVEDC